jgi:hypothetical protein
VVDNIFDNAQLANAGGFMRDKSVYIDKGADARVVNSKFLNFQFGVYVSGDVTTQASRVIVNACSFEHTTAAGSYTTEFPVGVYWFYSDNCVVNGCTFKNIYSSVNNGNSGTGMGYGVYEGDGLSTAGVISNNTFRYDAKGSKNAIGVYINEMYQCVINGNSFDVASGGRMTSGVRLDSKNQDSKYSINGNTFDIRSTAVSTYAILISDGLGAGTSTRSPKITIAGNTINAGINAIRQDFLGNAEITIAGNTITNTTSAGIHMEGSSTVPLKHPMISGNTIVGSVTNAILLNS